MLNQLNSPYLRLIRVNNLLFIAILMGTMEKFVAEPILAHYQFTAPLTWWMLALLIMAMVLISAGGYVINDYFDVKIDSINHPDTLIVTREVTKETAMRIFYALTGTGVACGVALGIAIHSMMLGALFVILPGLLWFYSASYKRQFLVGNLIVSIIAGITPLLVAFACDAVIRNEFGHDSLMGQAIINQIYLWTAGFGLFAFLCTWVRETIKDIEDQDGDRELECHTFPVKYGNLATKIFVTILILLTIALLSYLCFAVFGHFSWANTISRMYILLVVCFLCVLALLWKAQLAPEFHTAQQLMKLTMFLGSMAAIYVPALL